MSIDLSLNLAYGLVVRSDDTYALEKLFQDFPSSHLEKPADLIFFGFGADFHKKWGLASGGNVNMWTGGTPEALIVYAPSTYVALLDVMESANTPFPLLASHFPTASEDEKALLERMRHEYQIPTPVDHVLWARTS